MGPGGHVAPQRDGPTLFFPTRGETGSWFIRYWIYEEGASLASRAATADSNGDGISNALSYAFGFPAVGSVPATDLARLPVAAFDQTAPDPEDRWGGVEFLLPASMQQDAILIVEASPSLAPGSWSTIAQRTGTGAWQVFGTLHPKVRMQGAGGWVSTTVSEDLTSRRFYRLRALVKE